MRLTIIALAVCQALVDIGTAYRNRQAILNFQNGKHIEGVTKTLSSS